MIANDHPGLALVRECEWDCHLVGSRLVGKSDRHSDYDFLIVADSLHGGLYEWLKDNGWKPSPGTYGADPRLLSSDVWRQEWDAWPPIDLIPVCPEEAERRLSFFRAMQRAGDTDGGLLAKALKAQTAWPRLWAVLESLEDER